LYVEKQLQFCLSSNVIKNIINNNNNNNNYKDLQQQQQIRAQNT